MSGAPPNSTPPPGAKPVWGSYGAGGAVAPSHTAQQPGQPSQSSPLAAKAFGDEPLQPLSRRLLQVAGFLSVLLLAVLANSFLNSSEEGSPEAPIALNPVAAAAERVEENSGGRLSLYVIYSSPAFPQPVSAKGGGVYNEETERSRLTFEVTHPITGEQVQMIYIDDGEVEYEGGDVVGEDLPPGKEWVRTLESEKPEEDETPLNMEETMEMLDSSEQVKLVGKESINGKMTRRYRGEVRISELVDVLREKGKDVEADAYERIEGESPTQISAEAWVDRKNLLRRLRMVVPMPGEPGEPLMTVDMRMEFFDYGAKPDIKLPDPDSVVEGPLEEDDDAPSSASVS
ncbi:MAG: hypothetical protein M3Y75_02180 [Actinomycetota bacterium]|nr:hypothetical protein [Actinomycetota bacterium]